MLHETPQQRRKVRRVLGEYRARRLTTPSGQIVTDPYKAVAIALREARVSRPLTRLQETPQQRRKVRQVIDDYRARRLKTADGRTVTDPHHAVAIALYQAGVKRVSKRNPAEGS